MAVCPTETLATPPIPPCHPPAPLLMLPAQHLFHLNNQMSFRFQITAAICLTRPGVSLASSAWPTCVPLFPPVLPYSSTHRSFGTAPAYVYTYLSGATSSAFKGSKCVRQRGGRRGWEVSTTERTECAQCCKRALIILDALLLTPQQLTLECSSHLVLEDVNVLRTKVATRLLPKIVLLQNS